MDYTWQRLYHYIDEAKTLLLGDGLLLEELEVGRCLTLLLKLGEDVE